MMKLLYVDDEDLNLQLFEMILKSQFDIICATSGEEGLEKIKADTEISAVLSDLKMPGMDGLSFLKIVNEKHPELKCFILTGFEPTREISEYETTGIIKHCFQKPFDHLKLAEKIKSFV